MIYIIGSSGYIGKQLSTYLGGSVGFELKSADRSCSDLKVDLDSGCFSDLLQQVSIGDIVVFLSAISSPDVCAKEPDRAWRVNVDNTIYLINELTAKGGRVIFSSSDVVMGGNSSISLDDSSLRPSGIYGEMKAEVEKAVSDNPLVKVIRFSLVLGRGDKFTEMLKLSAKAGEVVDIFAGFERNIVSIEDVTEGIARLLQGWDKFPQKSFNFSGPDLVSREQLTAALAQVIPDLKYTVTEAPAGFWDNRERVIETDCRNFTKLLGRTPKNLNQIISEWVN